MQQSMDQKRISDFYAPHHLEQNGGVRGSRDVPRVNLPGQHLTATSELPSNSARLSVYMSPMHIDAGRETISAKIHEVHRKIGQRPKPPKGYPLNYGAWLNGLPMNVKRRI